MRKSLSSTLVFCVALSFLLAPATAAADPPLAEQYLLDGKLAEGAKALETRLTESPKDDQARFGLGILQFLQTFEHLGGGLYKYGLRTDKAFLRPPQPVKDFLPQNPNPQTFTYPAARQLVQNFVDDLNKAQTTLAEIQDPSVKLPLHIGLIKIDPFGQGKPISAAFALGRMDGIPPADASWAKTFVIGFDRGDVSWLRGYCHFLAAGGELLLAVDGQRAFDCGAHLLFEKVETPYTFLLENRRAFDDNPLSNESMLLDTISLFHQLIRLPLKEPARSKTALAHLEAGVGQAKEMWKFILAETDDDNEWIPNPKQHGAVGLNVSQEMVSVWLETLDEAELLLQGKKLIPFWRGKPGEQGVNLRRVFTEPRTFDLIEWMQGTAAAPYLEKGPLTKFADPGMEDRFNKAFGDSFNFMKFGFWFN